jgi:hypothetical protein
VAKWRKKPVVIDAEVYKSGMEDGTETYCSWYECKIHPSRCDECGVLADCNKSHMAYIPFINTLEGKHYITPGDYIITGVKGERYPCKPDIFHMTYEKVEEV